MTSALVNLIVKSKVSQTGKYIAPGNYELEVTNVEAGGQHSGECFIAEFIVRKSEQSDAKFIPNAVETACSIVYNTTTHRDTAPANTKRFVCGLFGEDTETVADERLGTILEGLINKVANPARGMLVRCEAFNKPKKDGSSFTHTRWYKVEQTPAEVKTRRTALDSAGR